MYKLKKMLKRTIIKFKNRGRKVKLMRGSNITIGTVFEGNNYIGIETEFDGVLGVGSYIGHNAGISAEIGRYCCIASEVKTVNGYHPIKKFVSMHPAFFSPDNCTRLTFVKDFLFKEYRYADENKRYTVIIGNDVWIGYGAILMAGITIGNGAVVAAGAIVTGDVEPYTIVGGIPAKKIRKRFSEDEILELEHLKWWDKTEEWIREHAEHFCDIDTFLRSMREETV